MSAYSENSKKVYSLNLPNTPLEVLEHLPNLPQIASELEAYFAVARKLEETLRKERVLAQKYRDELNEAILKHRQTSTELENKVRELSAKEEALKVHVVRLEAQLAQQAPILKNEKVLKHQLEEIKKENQKLDSDRKREELEKALVQAQLEQVAHREKSLRLQLQAYEHEKGSQLEQFQKNEDLFKKQIERLTSDRNREKERHEEERKREELEKALIQAQLDHLKQKENVFQGQIYTLQNERNQAFERLKRLSEAFNRAKSELAQHRKAWGQVGDLEEKARKSLIDCQDMTKKIGELSESVNHQKRRADDFEAHLQKERREKQIALSCLHTAESKVNQLQNKVQELQIELENQRLAGIGLKSDPNYVEIDI